MLFYFVVGYLLVAADHMHTGITRIQSVGQRLIAIPERNNRHVGSTTPAPAILRACSVKRRPNLSRRTQSITTINYTKPANILPTDSNTIHRYVQKCLSQRRGGTEVFFEIFIVGSCNPVLREPSTKIQTPQP